MARYVTSKFHVRGKVSTEKLDGMLGPRIEVRKYMEFIEMIKRRATENYCSMLLGTGAFPQISDDRPL